MGYSIEWEGKDNYKALESFVRRFFGDDSVQSQPGRVPWLCNAPLGGRCTAICREGANPVGVCFHLPVKVISGQYSMPAAFGMDLLVDPDFRRRGIGSLFLQHRCQRFGVSLSSGQSSAMAQVYRSVEGAVLVARWHAGYFFRNWEKPLNVRHWIRVSIGKLLATAKPSIMGKRTVLSPDSALAMLAAIGGRFREDEMGVEVSTDWFEWRYMGPVYRDYQFVALEEGDGRIGLAVVRMENGVEQLIDLYCPPEVRHRFFRLVGQTTPGNRLRVLCAGPTLKKDLERAGYLVRPTAGRIMAVTNDEDRLALLRLRSWVSFAGESDADLVRYPA